MMHLLGWFAVAAIVVVLLGGGCIVLLVITVQRWEYPRRVTRPIAAEPVAAEPGPRYVESVDPHWLEAESKATAAQRPQNRQQPG